jgi:hypothetical protein
VTLDGTELKLPSALIATVTAPAEFESVTVQVAGMPITKLLGLQVRETKIGAAHSVRISL